MAQSPTLARIMAETSGTSSPSVTTGRRSKSPKRTMTPIETHERARRIDTMLEEQVTFVREIQGSLQKVLYDLEHTGDQDPQRGRREKLFQDMLSHSQQLVVIVEVMLKIKNELAYARIDLEKAKKVRKGVEQARKRLRWLEERLEKLLLATRSQSRQLMKSSKGKPVKGLSERSDDIHSGLKEFLVSRTKEFFPDKSNKLSEGEINLHRSVVKELSDIAHMEKSSESLFRPESSASTEGMLTDDERTTSPDRESAIKESRDVVSSASSKVISVDSLPSSKPGSPGPAGASSPDKPRSPSYGEREQGQIRSRTSSSKMKSVSIHEGGSDSAAQEEGRLVQEHEEEDETEESYWKTDHHKFEWSKSSMLELDPLSWHALGIPVCDSFLPKERPKFVSELPWKEKPMTVNNVLDIHKLALDKLLVRLHRIYDSVNKCTQATIDPIPSEEKLETVMGNLELDTSVSLAEVQERPVEGEGLNFSHYDSTLPPISGIPRWRSATPNTRYKLMRVPSKSKIITKNPDKHYPRHSRTWSEDQPELFHVERIVKTRNKTEKTLRPLIRPKIQAKRISSRQSNRDKSSLWKKSGMLKVVKANKTLVALGSRDRSGRLDHSGPKWRRVQELLGEDYLLSSNTEIAKESAKSLGQLKCSESEVLLALTDVIKTNEDELVRYEASKSLILLGSWDEAALQLFLHVLYEGSDAQVKDLLSALAQGKNIQFVNKSSGSFSELSQILSSYFEYQDFEMAFLAAVCLGRLLVKDPRIKEFLMDNLPRMVTAQKAEALDVLVKQVNCRSSRMVSYLIDQLDSSTNWKHRVEAADLLVVVGKNTVLLYEADRVFEVLERLLWDHSSKELRSKVAETITALGLRHKACSLVLKRLEDPDETVRAHAIISLATLQMKTEKEMKLLLDILELDSSGYVRIQVVRAFSQLQWVDPRIIRSLKERERSKGVLGKEAKRALEFLQVPCEI